MRRCTYFPFSFLSHCQNALSPHIRQRREARAPSSPFFIFKRKKAEKKARKIFQRKNGVCDGVETGLGSGELWPPVRAQVLSRKFYFLIFL